jgi:hypothetical protein
MSLYTVEYSTGSKDIASGDWQLISGSYSGSSVPNSALNEFLYVSASGNTRAYFRTYISGSDTGSARADYNEYIIGGMNLTFTSYYTVSEHKYMCVVNRGEYNNTQNPSLYDISGSIKSSIVQQDTSGSLITTTKDENFHTFTTGIGLYDDALKLVAYAKFANPIKIEKNFDSVFIVKFDV